MEPNQDTVAPNTIVEKVFSQFLSRLQEEKVITATVAASLKKTLDERHYSVEKLKQALLSEDTL